MKSLSYISGFGLALVLSIGLNGCGGGGGGSSSGSTSGLSFPSNAVVAKPTLANGEKVKDATATNQIEGVPGLNSVDTNSKLNTALLSSKISTIMFKYTKNINFQSYALNEAVNETDNCSGGGTISYSGNGDDTHGGSVTVTANNCNGRYEKINGSMYMTIGNYDSSADNFKDYTIKFTTDFTVTNLSDSSVEKISKNSYMAINTTAFDSYGDMKDFKLSMSLQATDGSEYYGLQDCVFYYNKAGSDLEMYQTKGRIYIDNLASYVNYDTNYDMSQTPFVFSGYYGTLQSGEARYNMSSNGKVKIVVESNEAKTYVDADGDGTYELHD